MKNRDSLGDRMKSYEAVPKLFLMRRNPVIIRLDGSHFHTFTKGFEKPFDDVLIKTMQETMKYLCENVQGCVLGYTQSDEITLVLCDYQTLETQGWFNYNLEKIVSTSAALATLEFNRKFSKNAYGKIDNYFAEELRKKRLVEILPSWVKPYERASEKGATFDSRAFSVPLNEVNNCLLWRQQDATRNSIQGLAQSLYSHKEIEGINTKNLQNKMFTEKGVNWSELPTTYKRGSCCVKTENGWTIDDEIPIFSENPEYVNSKIRFE